LARIESGFQAVFLVSCGVLNLFCIFLLIRGALDPKLLEFLIG